MAIPATAQVLEIRLLSLQDWLIALALTAVSIGWRALGTGRLSGGTSARRPRG